MATTYLLDTSVLLTLINGKDIFYLSDKDRGFEFYTLRKITLREIKPAAPPPNAAAAPGSSQ